MSGKKYTIDELSETESRLGVEVEDRILSSIEYSRQQMQSDLKVLKDWLKNQHHLPPSRLTDLDYFFNMHLTGSKGSLETVKRKLDAYYSLRGKSEVYSNRDVLDPAYRKACETVHTIVIPKPTKNGQYLFINRLVDPDLKSYDLLNACKRMISIAELSVRFQDINSGCIALIDYSAYTPAHALSMTPSIVRDTIHLLQDLFPSRIQKILLFNVPQYFDIVINTLVKPFLLKKMKERLIVTSGGNEEIVKHIELDCLPKEYGGNYHLSVKELNDAWNECEISKRDWFLNELSEQVDETKRVIDSDGKNYRKEDSYFGVQGSLKKLVID